MEMVSKNIDVLKSLDAEDFYNKGEEEIRQYAHDAIQELIALGIQATQDLLGLLQTEFTWSCFLALSILRSTKDPQAVPALISFLKKESDDSMANEEAMFALQDIGDPSVVPLIEELEEAFENKQYNTYLVGALTGIIGPVPYDFMVKITKDFLSNHARYKGWFHIEDFTYNYVKQERADALPLLQGILTMKYLTGAEKRELMDTIRALEDPEGYEKEIEKTAEELSKASQKIEL